MGEASESPDDKDALFEALWKRCLEAWDDEGPHRAILEHALRTESLPDLAGRYRAFKDDPAKRERAQKKIDGIVAAAMQLMMATKTPARTKTPWTWTVGAVLAFLIVSTWLSWMLFFQHRR